MIDLIRGGTAVEDALRKVLQDPPPNAIIGKFSEILLRAPLPNAPKLLCVAGNYTEHILESGFPAPERGRLITPQFFFKFPSTCIIGPDDPVPMCSRTVAMDWELELAAVIGTGGREIRASSALDHVFGYTIINDISERKLNSDLQGRHMRPNDTFFDWLNGKLFDSSAPLGPAVITDDEIPDPQNLTLRLEVNGEVMQHSSTSKMIFTVAELIVWISQYVTLEPGDIIATGTPAGTGMSSGRFLVAGDVMCGSIEHLGCLRNRVVRASV